MKKTVDHRFIIILTLIECLGLKAEINVTNFRQQTLQRHNFYRGRHCVPNLVLNNTLNNRAQTYAEHLLTTNNFFHSGALAIGENLWSIITTNLTEIVNGSRPTDDWYDEIQYYGYNSSCYSSKTTNFTQLIWRNTSQLGVGITYDASSRRLVIVANYYPAGNWMNSFATNVLRPCNVTNATTIRTTNPTQVPSRTTTATPTITTSISTHTTSVNGNVSQWTLFQAQALAQHNYRRQLHCVPMMQLNASLNKIAQDYADYLIATNSFSHSGARGFGENLWGMSSSGSIGTINGSRATEDWYAEIQYYNFNSPGFSSGTGHFTQVVWKSSIQLGVGVSYSSTRKRVVVVANYHVAGNLLSAFTANVLAPCRNGSVTTG